MNILFIQTGGTIDKEYPKKTQGYAFEIGAPAVHKILKNLNPSFDLEVLSCCKKDSLEITDSDRSRLVHMINSHSFTKIIVTHGTDTIIDTGLFLEKHVKNKTVLLTGAMLPERFKDSDAAINLGAAIAAVQLKPSGVFIAMHGIVKSPGLIQRNIKTGNYY